MKTMTRRLGLTALLATAGALGVGCSSSGQPSGAASNDDSVGQLALPLTTQGASGVQYRLRDATFNIYRYGYGGSAGAGIGGYGMGTAGSGTGQAFSVSSETDPNAATISINLEEGTYYVELLPGWHFEKQTASGYEAVEATLLSGQTQYVWVSRRSTSFAEFQFGLGGREIWLNGDLNIGVVLYEDPSELGYGGYGGSFPGGTAGSAGSFPGGTAGSAGSFPGGTAGSAGTAGSWGGGVGTAGAPWGTGGSF